MSYLPTNLKEIIDTGITEFKSFDYTTPVIETKNRGRTREKMIQRTHQEPRLPKRIGLPMIRLPEAFELYLNGEDEQILNNTQQNKIPELVRLKTRMNEILRYNGIEHKRWRHDIEKSIRWSSRVMTERSQLESKVAMSVTTKLVKQDLALAALRNNVEIPNIISLPYWPSFLHIIQKIRTSVMINTKLKKDKVEDYTYTKNYYKMYLSNAGEIIAMNNYKGNNYIIYLNTNYYCLYDDQTEDLLFGDMDEMDYLTTHHEIMFNLKLINSTEEYREYRPVIANLIELINVNIPYENKVNIMKSYEALCLMRSDIIDAEFISWSPIVETMSSIIKNYYDVQPTTTEIYRLYGIYLNITIPKDKSDWLQSLLSNISKLSGTILQELSSLHKFMYYAIIDEEKGIQKYLKRVHTLRPCNPERINTLTNLAKLTFTINYYKRHNIMPQMEGPEAKKQYLSTHLKMKDYTTINQKDLMWWNDLEIVESLSKPSTHDPLEKAKDKGALKEEITHGPGDSEKELLQIIKKEVYNLTPLPLNQYAPERRPIITREKSLANPFRFNNPTRLIMKEREQKEEGRLFGNTTITNKHGLSYFMDQVKVVLSYFDGELMTISDKQRKTMLHEAGQYLIKKGYYSVLLDIEGHNQSMQYHNVGQLAKFCGKLFGEDNWDLLCKYFNHLHVYYYKNYINEVITSEGQLGGIEGWENPLWTLHTTLIVSLMTREKSWITPSYMVYSDDIAIITKLELENQEQLNEFFNELVNFFYDFGMSVKPSQTAISKNRVTILRNHYFIGKRSDATLKRLISSSIFNDDQLVSEEIEITALNSTISSAMEYTNNIVTCLLMKWYKGTLLCIRPIIALVEKERNNSLLSDDLISGELKSMLDRYQLNNNIESILTDTRHLSTMTEAIELGKKMGVDKYTAKEIKKLLISAYGDNTEAKIRNIKVDLTYYYLKSNTMMQELLLYRMIMPQSLGGYGFQLLVTQALSGHSHGFFKQLYYSKEYITKFFEHKQFFYLCLENALGIKFYDGYTMEHSKLVSNEFPIPNTFQSATTHINKAIKDFVKTKAVNKKIKQLFELENNKQNFAEQLALLNKEKFTYRIVRFYYETSKYHILDLLTAKIESSRGFLKLIKDIKKLRNKLFHLSLSSGEVLFMKAPSTFGRIDGNTDMLSYLYKMRQKLYPQYTFVMISEPLYDHMITDATDETAVVYGHFHRGIKVNKGDFEYLTPEFGNEVLYKAADTETYSLFEHIEQVLVFKVLMMTKWILFNSLRAGSELDSFSNTNIVLSADQTLQTFNAPKYDELEHLVHLPTGGEIMHRLPNMQFKTSANIRILPNKTIEVAVIMQQHVIHIRQLEDTNINFEYLRMRIKLAQVIQYNYDANPRFISRIGLEENENIRNVQIDFTYKIQNKPDVDKFNYTRYEFYSLPIEETNILCETYFTEENETRAHATPSKILIREANTNLYFNEEEVILQEYYKLRGEQLYINSNYCSEESWIPFINRYKRMIVKWSLMDNSLIYEDIVITLHETLRNRMRITTATTENINKSAIISLLINDLDLNELEEHRVTDVRLARLEKRPRNEINERWIQTQKYIKDITNKNEEITLTHVHRIIQLIAIKYALSVVVRNGYIIVNIIQTAENLLNIITFFEDMIPKESIELNLLLIHERALVLAYAEKHMNALINEIAERATKIDWEDIVIINLEKEKINWERRIDRFEIPPIVNNIRYNMIKLDNSCFFAAEKYKNLIKMIRTATALYAAPESFYSPTGSDSFVANLGLFKILMADKWVTHETTICDLTAGRGDANLAMKNLGLTVSSFTKSDIFTKIKTIENIQIVDDLDIYKQETIIFSLAYDHIHIDISHVKQDSMGISDLLKFLVKSKKQFTIRLNSIMNAFTACDWITEEQSYEFKLCYADTEQLLPYQIYLVARPSEWNKVMEVSTIHKSRLYKEILHRFMRITKMNRLLNTEPVDIDNSITHIMNKDLTLDEMMERTEEESEDDKIVEMLTKILRNWSLTQCFELSREHTPASWYNSFTGKEIDGAVLDYISYKNDKSNIGFHPRSEKYKKMDKHLSDLKQKDTKRKVIPLAQVTIGDLTGLRRWHPLQTVRSCANAILILLEDNIDIRNKTLEQIRELKITHTSENKLSDNKWTKNVKYAMQTIIYACIQKSYRKGLELLLVEYHGEKEHRLRMQNIIEIYRKMGKYYLMWYEETTLSMHTIQLREKILKNRLAKAKRQHLNITEKSVQKFDEWTVNDELKVPDAFFMNILDSFITSNIQDKLVIHQPLSQIIDQGGTPIEEVNIMPAPKYNSLDEVINFSGIAEILTEFVMKDKYAFLDIPTVDENEEDFDWDMW